MKKICLTLYAYGPKGAILEEMTAATGISNPSRNVLSIAGYKKYFRKLAKGKYTLSDVGISFVTNELLTELKGGNDNGSA